MNLVGEVVDHYASTWRGRSPAAAERAVAAAAKELGSRTTSPVLGMGVTLSGVVDHDAGVVRHSGLFGWEDVPLGATLSERVGVPVTVDKLVNALASSLVLYGEGRGVRDMLVVSAGHSIGLGIVLGAQVRHGLGGPTGSLGHTSVSVLGGDDSRPCHCGARGCLETVASEWALRAEIERVCGLGIDEAAERAADNEQVQRVFAVAGRALGGAVANIAKVINPERIVLGGEETRLGPAILEPFAKQLHHALSGATDHDIDVQVVSTDEQTWAYGAACQSLTKLFQVSGAREPDGEGA
ncbi:ROK family protein [Haloactinopolyspora alba]|uniref:ROK family protein n=1 Tax=Haloactinopolyspora alba TaxID=648780 RepID=UPI0013EA59EE|nr:ROK family protein [Haloactinopolyspora alba]